MGNQPWSQFQNVIRERSIDYNAGQACDVVIKVFTCIKTARCSEQGEKHVYNGSYEHYNCMETRLNSEQTLYCHRNIKDLALSSCGQRFNG